MQVLHGLCRSLPDPGKRLRTYLVPCKEACPAHIDVPGYLRLVAAGKRDEANAVIREKVPFPGILGRVCIHPCEEKCRRGEVNEPISICAVKRYAADGERASGKGIRGSLRIPQRKSPSSDRVLQDSPLLSISGKGGTTCPSSKREAKQGE